SSAGRSRQRTQKGADGCVELGGLFPVHETRGACDGWGLAETRHAGQDLRLIRIGIVRAAHAEHRNIEGAELRNEIRYRQAELEHAASILAERMGGEHLDYLLAHRRRDRDDLVDAPAALPAQQLDERLAAFPLEHLRGAQRILLPPLEVLERVVQL